MKPQPANGAGPRSGLCRLCLRDHVQLCSSHIIPKWAYRLARRRGENDLVQYRQGAAFLSTKQLQEHLLCRDCEDRFMTIETATAPLFQVKGRRLGLERSLVPDSATKLAWGPAGFPTSDISYLGMSVIWRAQISSEETSVELGDDEEHVRRYLMGEMPLLPHIELTIQLLSPTLVTPIPDMFRVFNLPTTDVLGDVRLHRLLLCGVLFSFWAGPHPSEVAEFGLLRGSRPLILRMENDGVAQYLGKSLIDAEVRGRLCRGLPT